ncbi:hypothetical protein CAP36_02125 [Chitinophagaceae bacterium IBVUCB2]|nr:hypothetical protein CAP36_02125 [Chitinophagaceae bacterium IBVUCB2]
MQEIKLLADYPSASGIEYSNKQYYIIGDDANNLLILDSNLNSIDSLSLYSFAEKRISKKIKADLEAILFTRKNKLLLIGSGSLSPYRNIAWLIDPLTKQKDTTRLDTFYQRLQLYGIKEINIEGACSIPGSIIISNRGSKGFPKNHLVFTSNSFWEKQELSPVTSIMIGTNTDSTVFNGVSGMAYASKSDQLILTVSTEDTRNNIDDGAIGKSYLWLIKSISSKKNWKAINPNRVIDLEKIDPRFKGQKIESVCITKETKNFLYLTLVADNDNGSSTLFKVVVEKD